VTLSHIDEAKRTLAQKMRSVRIGVHRNIGRAVAKIVCDQLQKAREMGLAIDKDSIVSGYWPIRDEVDTRMVLRRLHEEGIRCALPVTQGKDKGLLFRRWQPGDVLQEERFSVAVPASSQPVLIPETMLVPLLAIDREGNRLGYGGGYFDRTLLGLRHGGVGPVVTVGLAYEAQLVSHVPNDERDMRLDWLITEQNVYRFEPV
jgi:5-formyltetrahydrofolate cyclo-ligase